MRFSDLCSANFYICFKTLSSFNYSGKIFLIKFFSIYRKVVVILKEMSKHLSNQIYQNAIYSRLVYTSKSSNSFQLIITKGLKLCEFQSYKFIIEFDLKQTIFKSNKMF